MAQGLGDALAGAFIALIVGVILATAAITTALIFGLPWLWAMVKPWLHALTAT